MAKSSMIKHVFENYKRLGKVSFVKFVLRKDGIHYSVFVHFSEWNNDYDTDYFIHHLENGLPFRMSFHYKDDENMIRSAYWICLKNRSTKPVSANAREAWIMPEYAEEAEEPKEKVEEVEEEPKEADET